MGIKFRRKLQHPTAEQKVERQNGRIQCTLRET